MNTVYLMGGVGNWLFQIAFLEYLNTQGIKTYIHNEVLLSPHSSENYLKTVFKNWSNMIRENPKSKTMSEYKNHPHDWILETKQNFLQSLMFQGYFQNYTYITPSFLSKLVLRKASLETYPNIQNTIFLHIRGGDYVHHELLDIKLDSYYERAINTFPKETQFSVFTNDIQYAKSKSFLNNISYNFIEESDIDSLYLMSQCKGGICANSSFSWWGAYLNPNRQLILPSKWFNDPSFYKDGYYFQGCTIVEV